MEEETIASACHATRVARRDPHTYTHTSLNPPHIHTQSHTHATKQVPEGDYTIPLGQAEVIRQGKDVTVVGWGGQLRVLQKVGRCDCGWTHG